MPYREPPPCDHGVTFDEEAFMQRVLQKPLSPYEVRKRWPRFAGTCQLCGFSGIYYASYMHYIAGDW